LTFIQPAREPDRYGASLRLRTTPSRPRRVHSASRTLESEKLS
jgi:hypothetical protein